MASDLASRIKAKLTKRRHSVGATWTRSSSASRLTDEDGASSRSSTSKRPRPDQQDESATAQEQQQTHSPDDSQSQSHSQPHQDKDKDQTQGTLQDNPTATSSQKPATTNSPSIDSSTPRRRSIPSVVLAAPPNEPLKKPRPKSMVAPSAASSSLLGPDGNEPCLLDTTTGTTRTTTTGTISTTSTSTTAAAAGSSSTSTTSTTIAGAAPTPAPAPASALSYHPPPPLPVLTHPSAASTTLQSIHEDAALSPSNPTDDAAGDRDRDCDLLRDHELSLAQPAPDADQLSLLSAASASASNANTPGAPTVYTPQSSSGASRPPPPPRRKSLGSSRPPASSSSKALRAPLPGDEQPLPVIPVAVAHPISAMPATRKIWVKRPGASHTLVTINEDDLVDDVRDTILRKYANSLGKNFDAPDLTIRLHPRDAKDRLLQPDEHMCRTLDAHYPGGQTVEDAIIIDIPRRTPKASPRVPVPHTAAAIYYTDADGRPADNAEGYFPPVGGLPSPSMALNMPNANNGSMPHAIAVLGTGHLPTIPSPGGARPRLHRDRSDRPRLGRTQTTSSTMLANGAGSGGNLHSHGMQQNRPRPAHSRTHSSSSDPAGMPPPPHAIHPAAMPTSPGADHGHGVHPQIGRVATPPPRITTPRSSSARPKKNKKNVDFGGSGSGANNGLVASVPPISVLIVEDNPINLKLLEAFVKRLKVRWQTAMNGRDAVKKWRTGGFHLVLMDIQLPVMNGLEATREIRRLERVNSIGVFSSVPSTPKEELSLELLDKDRLEHPELFKGPVIIVALTASSLQSDRHEALAAGCNDFLTKV